MTTTYRNIPDPIFAAIERYNAAGEDYWATLVAAEQRLGKRIWGGHPDVSGAASAWRQATVELAGTRATTIAGALALAELIAEDCANIEIEPGEGGEAILLAGNLQASIAALARRGAASGLNAA